MRNRIAILFALPLAFATACGGTSGGVASGCGSSGDIVVGVIAPVTGAAAQIVGSFDAGAEQAATDINNKGGVCGGRHIRIVEKDNKSDTTLDAALAKELVEQDAAVGVVLIDDDDLAAAGPYLQQKHVLTVCACSSDANDDPANAKDTFSVAIGNSTESKVWAAYLFKTEHVQRPAVLYETTSSFGTLQSKTFCSLAQANGTPCVAQEQTTLSTLDVSNQISDMVQKQADSILVEGFGVPVVQTIKGARQAGITGPIMGTATVATSTNIINQFIPAPARQGFVFVNYRTATQGDSQAATQLASELKARGAINGPLFVPMFAHDAVELMAQGWNKAKSLNGDDASKAIEGFDIPVGDGTFTLHDAIYSPTHHEPQVPASWLTISTADNLDSNGLAAVAPNAAATLAGLAS